MRIQGETEIPGVGGLGGGEKGRQKGLWGKEMKKKFKGVLVTKSREGKHFEYDLIHAVRVKSW